MTTELKATADSAEKKPLSDKELLGTGMAFALIFLIVQWFVPDRRWPLITAMALLVVTMAAPALLRPAAVAWFGFAHLLGGVMSRLILTLIFLLIVVPIGLIVQRVRGDVLKLRAFKKAEGSLFVERNHTYSAEDLKHPY